MLALRLISSLFQESRGLTSVSRAVLKSRTTFEPTKNLNNFFVQNPCHTVIPVAGLKRHFAVHLRCPNCRLGKTDGRLSVTCSSHPRHNQLQWGRRGQKRLHKPYAWRWPDPFDKKYSSQFHEDRYILAFKE